MLVYLQASARDHDPGLLEPDHPDRPERIDAIERALGDADWLGCERRTPQPGSEAEIEVVHPAEHLRRLRDMSSAGGGRIDADTVLSAGSYSAAVDAVGAACTMVRALVAGEAATAFAIVRPSGHHAEADRAMGFCLLNNVAVAAELAIRELGRERVFVLDWDVHHGNGTAEIFRRRADVLYASIHQLGLFPGTGPVGDAGSGQGLGYTINAPVPKGSDEEVWCSVLEHVIVPAALEFSPQLVLISAGFDAHRDDPLGGCTLEAESFAQLACQARDLGRACEAPVGAVLEGGYEPRALAESTLATIAALGGAGEAESIAPEPAITPRIASHVAHFWTL